jgi:hypothetical protein
MSSCLGRNSIWVQHQGDSGDMFANALQVPLRAVKIHPLPFNTIPPKRQLSIKLLLASQAYETPAVIAAFLTEKQNTSDATGNCWKWNALLFQDASNGRVTDAELCGDAVARIIHQCWATSRKSFSSREVQRSHLEHRAEAGNY